MRIHTGLSFLIIAGSLLFLSSCSKTNKEGRYIPKTAAMAVIVNGESMSTKLPWEEVKQNQLFKTLYSDSSLEAYIKSALENPDNTGIDTKKNLIFFVQRDTSGGYVAFEGSIRDAAKFKQFNSNVTGGVTEIVKDDVHYLTGKNLTASWDKEKFVIIIDAPQMNDANKFRDALDTTDSPGQALSVRNLQANAAGIYNLKESASLAKDDKFTELVGSKGDVHFWMSIAALNSGSTGMAALSMLNLGKLYEDSYLTGVTNFENGRIAVDIKSYSGKEMTNIYKKYGGTKINSEMINRIPSKDIMVLVALSFKPEGLSEFIKLTGLDGFINLGTSTLGFSFDDFIKANKGDILFSLSDLKKDSAGDFKMDALFAASVGDKNSFGKLINAGNKLGKGNLGAASQKLSFNVSDNYFAIGTEKTSVDKFISTPTKNNFTFADKIYGGPSAFYVNIQLLMNSIPSEMKRDSLDNIAYNATLGMWDNILSTGGGYKDGGVTQHIEINLLDKNSNSLKQLNKYLGVMGSIQEQKRATRNKWMESATEENLTEDLSQ